jgi:hypothetical protein
MMLLQPNTLRPWLRQASERVVQIMLQGCMSKHRIYLLERHLARQQLIVLMILKPQPGGTRYRMLLRQAQLLPPAAVCSDVAAQQTREATLALPAANVMAEQVGQLAVSLAGCQVELLYTAIVCWLQKVLQFCGVLLTVSPMGFVLIE